VRFGDLRRLVPLSRRWGKDRGGKPIDRYYIERFLGVHATDVHGRVLEAGDDAYTRRFGGARVVQRDVLHALEGNPAATIVADLAAGDGIPSDAFDCVILTQVLQMIPDPSAAVRTVYRILRPGGTLLATLPGISQVSRWDQERWGDYWRFTTLATERLLLGAFPAQSIAVTAHGNVLAALAFLHGLAAEELQPAELDFTDSDFQLLITARATKSCVD
jgi:SAM-dependent methyltransferase